MTKTFNEDLQVNGSLNLRDDFKAGNTLYAVGRPVGSEDYMIELGGSTPNSVPPNKTYLEVDDRSMGMGNFPGINTVILNPNGTYKAKKSHDVSQNASQWNSWADWVNAEAKDGDVVAVASFGVAIVASAPRGGSAETLLLSIKAGNAFGIPPTSAYALLFIKGQARALERIGYPLPTPPYPSNSSYFASFQVSYHQLLKPFSGRVGIGTAEPKGNLHIVSDGSIPLRIENPEENTVALSVKGGETELVNRNTVLSVNKQEGGGETIAEFIRYKGDASVLLQSNSSNEVYLRFKNSSTGNNSWMAGMDDDEQFKISYGKDGEIKNSEAKLKISQTGNVDINGRIQVTDGVIQRGGPLITQTRDLGLYSQVPRNWMRFVTNDAPILFYTDSGIGSQAQLSIERNGNVIINNDLILRNADCAEEFDVSTSEDVVPGMVVVLGSDGKLQPSTDSYDKRVVGVVSGAGDLKPGLILDKKAEQPDRLPVALMGKVYCKVDAQYASIEVGDLLTTSPTVGHAMKASDPQKAFGTVIGKAMRSLKEGADLIPILIALQ